MKNGFRHLAFTGLLALALPCFAQRNEVFYNLFNDSISYRRDGRPVKELKLRKGDEVRVHLTEFNPFTSDVQLDVEEVNEPTAVELSGMAGLGGLMPEIPNPDMLGGILGGGAAGGGAPILDIPVVTFMGDTLNISSILGISRGGADANQANELMGAISSELANVNSLYNQIKAVEKAVLVSKMAIVNVPVLRQQPNLRPSLVQRMCTEYYEAVFSKSPGEPLSLNDLLAWQDIASRYDLLQQRLKSSHSELNNKIALLDGMAKAFSSLPTDNTKGQQYLRELIDFNAKSKAVRDQVKDYVAKPSNLGELPSVQDLADLQLQLAEVISNEFTHHTTLQPLSDQVLLHIKLQRKPDETTEAAVIKERNLRLEIRGGLKVRASAGLTFGQFFKPAQQYSVSNGEIVGEDEGAFTPSLTSFLHFHGYRGQKATLGGTFGAGFPLLSNSDGQSPEFYLGPSLMMGAAQKLVITCGLKGGRVQRLSKGYQVGDAFDTDFGDIPTAGKYDLGWFLGVSFILGN